MNCCQRTKKNHHPMNHVDSQCGCGGHSFQRSYCSTEERKQCLVEYRDSLEKEMVAVNEKIAELK